LNIQEIKSNHHLESIKKDSEIIKFEKNRIYELLMDSVEREVEIYNKSENFSKFHGKEISSIPFFSVSARIYQYGDYNEKIRNVNETSVPQLKNWLNSQQNYVQEKLINLLNNILQNKSKGDNMEKGILKFI
jgi:hypothetical protein